MIPEARELKGMDTLEQGRSPLAIGDDLRLEIRDLRRLSGRAHSRMIDLLNRLEQLANRLEGGLSNQSSDEAS